MNFDIDMVEVAGGITFKFFWGSAAVIYAPASLGKRT